MRIDRVFAMPNKWTFQIKPIRDLIDEEKTPGLWLDPFVGQNDIEFENLITNDLNPNIKADHHMMALEFLKKHKDGEIDGVIYDPPYSAIQIKRSYENVGLKMVWNDSAAKAWTEPKNEIARILKPGGKAICCGWNSNGIGKTNGFKMERVLLVAHGGWHNDTIITVERKMNHSLIDNQ